MPDKRVPPASAGKSIFSHPGGIPLAAPRPQAAPRAFDPALAKRPKATWSGKGSPAQRGKSANRLIPAQKSRGR